jgi:hypothetical protein
MKQLLRIGFLLITTCVASGLGLQAQTVIYATDFPDAVGWTLSPPVGPFAWDVDATPANVLGSSSWHSAPYSLNFNDGFTYGGAGPAYGSATSPAMDLSNAIGPVKAEFWCNFEVEAGASCNFYDRRLLQVINSSGQVAEYCFVGVINCGPPGQWHFHSVLLDASWGIVQLRFFFATGDGWKNDGAGWFVDDLEVREECPASAGYCTPKINSQGCSPVIYTTGTPSLGGVQGFRIWASNVLNQKPGIMVWSRTPAATPFLGGTLCIAPPVTRTPAQNSGGSAPPAVDCTGTYGLQFTQGMMNQAGLAAGDDVYSQYWSRDNGFPPPTNVGLTAGVHWVVCQ